MKEQRFQKAWFEYDFKTFEFAPIKDVEGDTSKNYTSLHFAGGGTRLVVLYETMFSIHGLSYDLTGLGKDKKESL